MHSEKHNSKRVPPLQVPLITLKWCWWSAILCVLRGKTTAFPYRVVVCRWGREKLSCVTSGSKSSGPTAWLWLLSPRVLICLHGRENLEWHKSLLLHQPLGYSLQGFPSIPQKYSVLLLSIIQLLELLKNKLIIAWKMFRKYEWNISDLLPDYHIDKLNSLLSMWWGYRFYTLDTERLLSFLLSSTDNTASKTLLQSLQSVL